MDTHYYSSTSDEEDEPQVIDLTNVEQTPPAPPAPNPRKRRAVRKLKGRTTKRECVEPPKSGDNEAYKCPICIEYVRHREPVATKCGHVFCKECIQAAKLRSLRCPLCKKRLLQRNLRRVYL